MKMQAIKDMAVSLGIKAGKMKKTELIRAIQSTEGNNPCFQTNSADTCGQMGCCWRDDCVKTQ